VGIGVTILAGENHCLKEGVYPPVQDTCHMHHVHHEVPTGGVTNFVYSPYTNVGTAALASGTLNSRDVSLFEINHDDQIEFVIIKTKG